LNGLAELDDCNNCLLPDDPSWNDCVDCNGIPFGMAMIDSCGFCLQPGDSDFNQRCIKSKDIFIPNAFSPNEDGINEYFRLFRRPGTDVSIREYIIYSRWGSLLYRLSNIPFDENVPWWDGHFQGSPMDPGVYVYYIELEYQDGIIQTFKGDISLIK
jgi:gliding motility-associated-like protein